MRYIPRGWFRAVSFGLLVAGSLWAQRVGTSAPAGASSGSVNSGSGTRGTLTNIPTNTNRFPSTDGTQQRPGQQLSSPVFLSGQVLLDDGAPPTSDIRIERVCNSGNAHLETHTDSKGRFSFQLGQNSAFDGDASTSGFGDSLTGVANTQSIPAYGGRSAGSTQAMLWNCEIRAAYPGYSSDSVPLTGRQPLDAPNIGTIVLHHLGAAAGTTVSVTSSLAPKNAQKAYQKSQQLLQKGKVEEATEHLKEATALYPKYAVAWYALGEVQQRQGQSADARKSYEAAVAADGHYVNPYDQLARLAAQSGNWEEAIKFSKQAISLNPVQFPSSFWYNAVASYQLKNAGDAEKSVRDLLKLDTRHRYPQAENLMGQLLLDKGNYSDAATHLKAYLTLLPNATDADNVKRVLSKIQGENALTKSAPVAAPK